jgi:hypothetical protein
MSAVAGELHLPDALASVAPVRLDLSGFAPIGACSAISEAFRCDSALEFCGSDGGTLKDLAI